MTRSAEKPGSDPFKLVFLNFAMCSEWSPRHPSMDFTFWVQNLVSILLTASFEPLRLI